MEAAAPAALTPPPMASPQGGSDSGSASDGSSPVAGAACPRLRRFHRARPAVGWVPPSNDDLFDEFENVVARGDMRGHASDGRGHVEEGHSDHLVRKPVAVTQNQVGSKSTVFYGLNASK